MRFLLDKDVSSATTLWNAILYIFGFNNIHSKHACVLLGRQRTTLMKNITNRELYSLDKKLRKGKFLVGHMLERDLYLRTSELMDSNAYRAIRIRQGLPSRGQRTHSNAKTAKRNSGLWENSNFAKKMKRAKLRKRKFSFSQEIEKHRNNNNKNVKFNSVKKPKS